MGIFHFKRPLTSSARLQGKPGVAKELRERAPPLKSKPEAPADELVESSAKSIRDTLSAWLTVTSKKPHARASFRYDASPPVLRKTAPAQRPTHTGEAPSARPAETLQRLFEEEGREQNDTKASAGSPPGKPLGSGAMLSGRERLRRTHSDLDLGPDLCNLQRAAASNEDVGELLLFGNVVSARVRNEVFHEGFRTKEGLVAFLNAHLKNGSVEEQLRQPAQDWSAKTFQAVFVAAWASRPTEKCSVMIDLSGLSKAELDQLRKAYVKSGSARPSSHFSGKGRSASEGFSFLKGYRELLVQMEDLGSKPYLFLKAEGHTTGLSGIVRHTRSYFRKVRTGEGLIASPALHALALSSPRLVERRAAENYAKNYGEMLQLLGFDLKKSPLGPISLARGNKKVTAREMTVALFARVNFRPQGTNDAKAFVASASNSELGHSLVELIEHTSKTPEANILGLTGEMLKELGDVANSLIRDGDEKHPRVHREIIVTPKRLDESLLKSRR